MGVAFSDVEMETIRQMLKARARECMTRFGVQKTSVKDIVSAAGISTGAFYKFYDSKERLFFDVMEDMHVEIYDATTETFIKYMGITLQERVVLSLMASIRKTEELGLMQIWEAESAYILRKLPAEVLASHYTNEGTQIVDIFLKFGIQASIPSEIAAKVIQCLLTALSQPMIEKEQSRLISEFMVRAVCEKLFPNT
jgi:AcrR family transcriptional regulator